MQSDLLYFGVVHVCNLFRGFVDIYRVKTNPFSSILKLVY